MNIQEKNNKIRGSLIGGAVGDALGYPVEFLQDYQIFERYGCGGIEGYALKGGVAQISDDTQMTMFTAEGIITYMAQDAQNSNELWECVAGAYQDWLFTQESGFKPDVDYGDRLLNITELYSCRAPGITCLSALKKRRDGYKKRPLEEAVNDSKGCGGIMRIAPLGLWLGACDEASLYRLQKTAAELSAITHGHPLGYASSAVLAHIINRLVYGTDKKGLKEYIAEALDVADEVFAGKPHISQMKNSVYKAMELAENNMDDLENIRLLGEGWVAEETLAIAIYCSVKYQDDFSKGVIAAVNHSGDSDSTGAVTGNILGALLGYECIDEKWTEKLELKEIIIKLADRLSC